MRGYSIFQLKVEVATRDRMEDAWGDFTGYGPIRQEQRILNIVAPNETYARCWVAQNIMSMHKILTCECAPLDALIEVKEP